MEANRIPERYSIKKPPNRPAKALGFYTIVQFGVPTTLRSREHRLEGPYDYVYVTDQSCDIRLKPYEQSDPQNQNGVCDMPKHRLVIIWTTSRNHCYHATKCVRNKVFIIM